MLKHFGKSNPYVGKEDNFQRATARILRSKYPTLWESAFHVPNGGKRPTTTRTKNGRVWTYNAEGRKMKEMGARAGVSDWIMLVPSGGFHGLIIELKTKGGTLQDTQKKFLDTMTANGYFTAVCWSLDGFMELLNEYFKK